MTSARPLLGPLALVLALVLAIAEGAAADGSACGPFDVAGIEAAERAAFDVAMAMDPDGTRVGGSPSSAPSGAGSDPTGTRTGDTHPGEIVRIPAASTAAESDAAESESESEAILALPKNEAGQIPTDFELGVGVEIRESFFSPVICATVALLAGPAGASLEQLVTVVPDGSAVVPNDVYASASTDVRPVVEAPTRPDPYLSLQYGLAVTGVREARGLSRGAGVKIALLDSAPDAAHQDLSAARIHPVEGEGEPIPEVGVHGTLMAGVIGAIEGNGFGIAGMAPDAELISIPICRAKPGTAGGQCTIFDLLRGLDRAWDNEASIVNLALSGPPNVLLARGVARLEELGAVLVAAAGNDGSSVKRYPAAYPSVIGVGAIDREGRVFEASNRGPWVELAAPGVDILSTVPGSKFAFGNGTSLAAAHVTGALALLTSVTHDPKLARGELFRAANAGGSTRTPAMPPLCRVFARLGMDCAAAAAAGPAPAASEAGSRER